MAATCPALRPWELAALSGPPGVTTLQLFDRIVSVHRLRTIADEPTDIGDTGYSGAEQIISPTGAIEGEDILFTGLAAQIQVQSAGRSKGPLPADLVYKPSWKIFVVGLPIYSIRDRDIITDDEGYRYVVGANYYNGLQYELSCIRLEA